MPGYELIGKEEKEAVNEVFDKGEGVLFRFGFDSRRNGIFKVAEFEKEFAGKFNVRFSRAVSSGTAALHCALKGLDIKAGDEVITQSHTFVATVETIIEAGAIPVITEINKTLNMDPQDLERKITERTRAIIPVHILGVPCQMDEIVSIAKKNNIPILEDTAQAIGGEYKGRKLGTIGDVGIFSFDFGKTLTTGEGGMFITDNEEIYWRAREYSDHGHQDNPNFPRGEDTRRMSGLGYRMAELEGAVGLAQLKKLDYILEHSRENKRKIKEGLKDIPGIEFRELPDPKGDCGDALIFFLKTAQIAEKFAKMMAEKGLSSKNIPSAHKWHFAGTWEYMLSRFDRYKGKNFDELWPDSKEILSRTIALPVLVKMDEIQFNKLINDVKEIAREVI